MSADGTEKTSSQDLTLQARASQVVVRTLKDLYGRGPTHSKTCRVEDVIGQKVVSYHSQVLFDPDRLVEIFVLDSPVERGERD